jgi:hypothetical protein
MNSTASNGSPQQGGHSTRSGNASNSVIQLPKFSSSRPNNDLAAAIRRAQIRRAAAAAAADARRRTVIALVLALLGMVAGAVVVEREVQMQGQEVRRG